MSFKLPGANSSNSAVSFVANTANPNPAEGLKWTADKAKSDLAPPKPPGPTQAQLDLERQQREAMTTLDAQENERRKRLLAAMQGVRAFTGSALFRSQPNGANTAQGTGASATAVAAPTSPSASYGRVFDPGSRPTILQS